MRTLNLGILAHVDAGKTTLTERLLHAAGVIDEIGSVDDGTTQTDSLALERQRGITIKAAVVSFVVGDVTINLIDTPGHPDFIAEVERVLGVLDGAVLVVSAVEGVQAQTRVLMRTLRRLRVPTIFFVNKIDRAGADHRGVVRAIAEKLTPSVVAMNGAGEAGFAQPQRLVEVLADHDDTLLAAFVERDEVPHDRLHAAFVAQCKRAVVHPAFVGSAITGAGVDDLTAGIVDLLPAAEGDASAPLSAAVFKIERGDAGERIAYARVFAGTIRVRDRLRFGDRDERTVTAIRVFDRGGVVVRPCVTAGHIAKLWGLGDVRIGDAVGDAAAADSSNAHHFAPPTLEAVITPRHASERGALHAALAQLAEQDPLINLRQDGVRHELYVSLYGEVQKEVVQETLATDFGIQVDFHETTTICIERPSGTGAAAEFQRRGGNPFLATIGLRIDPAPIGSGVTFELEVEFGSIPHAFHRAVEETVRSTLQQGLYGWEVTDCTVTMTHSGYSPRQSHAHQRFDASMSSTGADFRNLTPLVVMAALRRAGTRVCEPIHRFRLDIPADVYGVTAPALVRLRAVPRAAVMNGAACTIEGDVPAARVHDLQQLLPGLTRGEGALESAFDRYEPVRAAAPPRRSRTDNNPLDRKEYLLRVTGRVS